MTRLAPARSALALAAVSALALGTLPSPALAATDPAPLQAGTDWLGSQLTDGVVHNDQFDFDDLGLTVDVGLALAEVEEDSEVDTISAALAPRVRDYYTYSVAESKTHVSAGSLAKAAAFAQAAGDDATAYGDQDLVDQLEARVSRASSSAGRIGDVFFPEEQFEADFANVIGQAFAAHALAEAGSARTGAVTSFLRRQQCSAGYFRLDLGSSNAATCDAASPAATPNTDATALAVLNLLDQADAGSSSAAVAASVDRAVAWLLRTQAADGSFGSDAQITTANANSTGLAGWVLGLTGHPAHAERAASWLRAHQLDNVGSCAPYAAADLGAIAYDDAALASVAEQPISVNAQDQFRRAASQALPALRSATTGTGLRATTATTYVEDGRPATLRVTGAAPGSPVCLEDGAVRRTTSRTGSAVFTVTVPDGTGTTRFTVTGDTGPVTGEVTALGAKTLGLRVRSTVRQGATQRAIVSGLAAGEKVSVRMFGRTVRSGVADARGVYNVTFPVSGSTGTKSVSVLGEFSDRKATTSFTVTR